MAFEWSSQVREAEWWARVLHPFAQDVGSVLPDTFAAYARVLHPVGTDGMQRTWADVAAENQRILHPEAQFHQISRGVGTPEPERYVMDRRVQWGSLPKRELELLAGLLAEHTTTPDLCWCCVWEGYAQLHRVPEVAADVLPQIKVPHRAYYIMRGPLNQIGRLYESLSWQSPNIWWPDDRSWCVATEVDFAWTYVGAEASVIAALLDCPGLEALPATSADHFTYDTDIVNARLDLEDS